MTIEISARKCCADSLAVAGLEDLSSQDTKDFIRARYASVASGRSSCCDEAGGGSFAQSGYERQAGYEPDADLGLGCGVPTELVGLSDGETVLDLGSGAGIDAFIAAREVGETGRVVGLDFTAEMIARARENARKLLIPNVEFVQGDIESMPIEDDQIDVVISNCVLNLVPDKARAAAEIHRVLRPGGRFAISDIVVEGELPERVRTSAAACAACVSGAVTLERYLGTFTAAGLVDVEVRRSRRLEIDEDVVDGLATPDEVRRFAETGGLLSVTVTGRKPG